MNEEFDFCVIVTTYNRSDMLIRLIKQIQEQKENLKIKIIVFDDGSSQEYQLPDDVLYIKVFPNRGKKLFWKIIDSTFKVVKNVNSKYYIYLQDDVEIKDNFFSDLVNIYSNIDDKNKLSLSFLTDHRVLSPNWTNYKPKILNEIIKTQWVELHFICERKFFDVLEYKIDPIPLSRWKNNPNLSSGVGWQLSVRIHSLGYGMYHTKETFVRHGEHESKMNKNERLINKLIV